MDFTGTDFSDPKTGIHATVLLEDAFVDFHSRVIFTYGIRKHVDFTRVKKPRGRYEVSRVNVKVERVSPSTFTRDLSSTASILLTHV